MYIMPQTWTNIKKGNTRKGAQCIPDELAQIRQNSKIQILTQEHPSAEQWITKPYTDDEVASVLRNLKIKINGGRWNSGESVQNTKYANN